MASPLTDDAEVAGLSDPLPTARMAAAQWFVSHGRPEHRTLLLDALTRENVPRIRDTLASAIKTVEGRTRAPGPGRPLGDEAAEPDTAQSVLEDLAKIIRHEIEPAIGWIRSAAHREIEDFVSSRTNSEIEALRRRLRGLVSLAAASRIPSSTETVSLTEIVSQCTRPAETPELTLEAPDTADDLIATDRGLMALIIENALQNAIDASRMMPAGESAVVVSHGVSDRGFWLTISNRFPGTSFELADVASSGVSTKTGQRGLGVTTMRLAARRLGYDLDLRAAGGVALFSLRGDRRRG